MHLYLLAVGNVHKLIRMIVNVFRPECPPPPEVEPPVNRIEVQAQKAIERQQRLARRARDVGLLDTIVESYDRGPRDS